MKVKCIEPGDNHTLTLNAVYEVRPSDVPDFENTHYDVYFGDSNISHTLGLTEGWSRGWYRWRFEILGDLYCECNNCERKAEWISGK